MHDSDSTSCSVCSKKFKNMNSLDLHIQSEHADKKDVDCKSPSASITVNDSRVNKASWVNFESVVVTKKTNNRNVLMYKCKICETLCFTIRSIRLHLKKDHAKKQLGPSKCEECGKMLAGETELKRHVTVMHRNKGKRAHETVNLSKNEIKTDSEAVRNEPESSSCFQPDITDNGELFHCEACLISFPTALKMRKHLKEKHSRHALHKFNYMIKGFKRFKVGYNWTNGASRFAYQCLICKKQTNSLDKVAAHMKSEHNIEVSKSLHTKKEEGYSNRYKKATNLGQNLSASEQAKANEEKDANKNSALSETKGDPPKFFRRKGFKKKRFGTKKLKPKGSHEDPCHCLDCGVLLKTEWELDHHYKTVHSGPNFQVVPKYSVVKGKYNLFLKCLICGKMCRSKGILKQHLRSHDKTATGEGNSHCANNQDILAGDQTVKSRKGGAKRSGSCIYHCRTCGKSFPRLFNYNEHICVTEDSANRSLIEETETQSNMEVVLPEFVRDVSDFVKTKSKSENDTRKLGLTKITQEKKKSQEENLEDSQLLALDQRNVPLGSICCEEQSTETSTHKVLFNPEDTDCVSLPLSPLVMKDKAVSKIKPCKNGKRILSRKYSCRFCKRCFPHQKQLAKHEKIHTEAHLHACSNCGMSFTALHKLRYHSMRCILNNEGNEPPIGNVDKPNAHCVVNDSSFNGRVNGNTYPSYARKSEYTVFDPANRPDQEDLNDNIGMCNDQLFEGQVNIAGTSANYYKNSCHSSLDHIVIADVRSCNPAFSQRTDIVKSNNILKNQIDVSNVDRVAALQPANDAPGFYLDPLQAANSRAEDKASHPVTVISPDCAKLNMYTQGTVLLVPYFVPAGETYSKIGEPHSGAVAPKPAMLPPGSFMLSPNDFNARISPCADWKFFPQPLEANIQSQVTVAVEEGFKARMCTNESALEVQPGGTYSKSKKESKSYDCSVCAESFSTFGNFIKHRESHNN